MFERILIPTDFSWYAQKTLFCALEIPGVTEAILLHITDNTAEPTTWKSLAEVRNAQSTPAHALAYAGETLEKAGISVTYEVAPPGEMGIPAAILASAERHCADLILIGGKGRGFLQDMLLGRVSQKVLEEAKVHVLVTHFDEKTSRESNTSATQIDLETHLFSRILIPVDFSRPTFETIQFMSEMGGFEELILLHVIARVEGRKDLEKKLGHSMQRLSSLQRDLDSGIEKITPRIRFGDPGEEICNLAEEEKANLIIISRFGASENSRNALIGSVAVKVVKHARIPVLVRYPSGSPDVQVQEITRDEFSRAEDVWSHYRQQKADQSRDRIFGVFVDGELVSVARCRRHSGGIEVDGVFTLDEFRGRGYARKVVSLLVRECGNESLFTYSTKEMIEFFESFGFFAIQEREIPSPIQERYSFAMGDLRSANLYPMRRNPAGEHQEGSGMSS